MKLSDLHPELKGTIDGGVLMFDCPHPGCSHRVRIPISRAPYHERELPTRFINPHTGKVYTEKVWQASGEFPQTISLTPSVDIIEANEKGEKIRTLCWHGHLTNGEIT